MAALAGCGVNETNPCDGIAGACLAIHVEGSAPGADTLSFDLSGAATDHFTRALGPGVTLPAVVAVTLKPDAAGALTVSVAGLVATRGVGSGSAMLTLVAGAHNEVHVTLTGAASCTDGTRNQDETGIDCGGAVCPPCANGQMCNSTKDCAAGVCAMSLCVLPSCMDKVLNGSETDVDCGGTCPPCMEGNACKRGADCDSLDCVAHSCAKATCADAILNGMESDVDCGQSCVGRQCADGLMCKVGADCQSRSCVMGQCATAICSDGVKNGNETDIDCGGPTCGRCDTGKSCAGGNDCVNGKCNGTPPTCAMPDCSDGLKNGSETDVDCGGMCKPCGNNKGCLVGADCTSGRCAAGQCVSAACSDGMKDFSETDIDCGGADCPACITGKACGAASDCMSGVCTAGKCAPPSCSDSVKNGTETDVDCGGGCMVRCAMGKMCTQGSDCASAVCASGACAAPSCSDGVKNGSEPDVDCGGSCASKCGDGKGCAAAGDCASGVCSATTHTCATASCSDMVKNGHETDVDCGGGMCGGCANGKLCSIATDCTSGVCTAGKCATPTCMDVVKNGNETDVDCGGGVCMACTAGKSCLANTDCTSALCTGGRCPAAGCSDGAKNGSETDVDCGGMCAPCANGKVCIIAADCTSGVCTGGKCATPSCMDGVANGGESDVDCGGATMCLRCAATLKCTAKTDCASGVCTNGVCQTATCSDTVKNGSESDVDCGGSKCAGCPTGGACMAGGDCASGVCASSGKCAAPTCSDGVANGSETDIDCGGSSCGPCANGKMCKVIGDCQSGVCTNGTCAAPSCTDKVKNGVETDVDCGGAASMGCSRCGIGQMCGANSDCVSGLCNTSGVCAAVSCTDGMKNGNETDVDCGGTCPGCANGGMCKVAMDCKNGVCSNGVCTDCFDRAKNGSETDVDCGGPSCPQCPQGSACAMASDCRSGVCSSLKGRTVCLPPTCNDGIKNGTETDVDCGSSTPTIDPGMTSVVCFNGGCQLHRACNVNNDCESGLCMSHLCVASYCNDGAHDSDETDVDCGPSCLPCAVGKASGGNSVNCASRQIDGGGKCTALSLSWTEKDIVVGTTPQGLAAGDLNHDGKPELVVSVAGSNSLVSLAYDSTQAHGFNAVVGSTAITNSPRSIAIGDLNRDGSADVVVATTTGQLLVLLGNGDRTFHSPVGYSSCAITPTIFDQLGDGNLDLVLSCGNARNAFFVPGNGDGTFPTGAGAVTQLTTTTAFGNATGDFDNDGKIDIAIDDNASSSTVLFSGSSSFKQSQSLFSSPTFFSSTADMNHDGIIDLVTTVADNTGVRLRVILGGANIGNSMPIGYGVPGNNPSAPGFVVIGDYNLDGYLDAGTSFAVTGGAQYFTMLGGVKSDGTFQLTASGGANAIAVYPGPVSLATADFNGDGKPDVAAHSASNDIAVFLNTSN